MVVKHCGGAPCVLFVQVGSVWWQGGLIGTGPTGDRIIDLESGLHILLLVDVNDRTDDGSAVGMSQFQLKFDSVL